MKLRSWDFWPDLGGRPGREADLGGRGAGLRQGAGRTGGGAGQSEAIWGGGAPGGDLGRRGAAAAGPEGGCDFIWGGEERPVLVAIWGGPEGEEVKTSLEGFSL